MIPWFQKPLSGYVGDKKKWLFLFWLKQKPHWVSASYNEKLLEYLQPLSIYRWWAFPGLARPVTQPKHFFLHISTIINLCWVFLFLPVPLPPLSTRVCKPSHRRVRVTLCSFSTNLACTQALCNKKMASIKWAFVSFSHCLQDGHQSAQRQEGKVAETNSRVNEISGLLALGQRPLSFPGYKQRGPQGIKQGVWQKQVDPVSSLKLPLLINSQAIT